MFCGVVSLRVSVAAGNDKIRCSLQETIISVVLISILFVCILLQNLENKLIKILPSPPHACIYNAQRKIPLT